MTKKDYTKYNKQKEVKEPVVDETVTSLKSTGEVNENVYKEDTIEEKESVEQRGMVCDCVALNIRKKPFPNSEIVGVINKSTEVIIDVKKSKGDFYKVCTPAGIEGYCMKAYIKLV